MIDKTVLEQKTDEVMSTLKMIAAENLETDVSADDIDENASLYEDGIGLDSINVVSFIVAVEEKFELSFDGDDINTSVFSNLKSLAEYISARKV
ncbi:acyl carrier protein [Pedobacter sp. KBW06]|uniref:phosphopantetheine-binding protein n=1 Tax=Pedobacter sp. KBW06 TaxID=2153359 RepID=UPI000F599FCD|nr:phosphopantetheine-binding protein [Pedobacter sp. KBW06]RQO65150.1 acyl carrier protein [Pedobacter sp. KBW06]